jgi:hypothetical protein
MRANISSNWTRNTKIILGHLSGILWHSAVKNGQLNCVCNDMNIQLMMYAMLWLADDDCVSSVVIGQVMTYAVRGPLLIRANQIEKELKEVKAERDVLVYFANLCKLFCAPIVCLPINRILLTLAFFQIICFKRGCLVHFRISLNSVLQTLKTCYWNRPL